MKRIVFIVVLIAILLSLVPMSAAYADTSVYSDVLADLQANEDFDINDYPINQTDFSLNVLQLAEGNDNSLLVYVYQPSAGKYDVRATKIRMSVDGGQNYYDYNLTLLSRNSVFFKYKVDNYVADVSSSLSRTYDVVQIMRPADIALGDTVLDEHNNTISMVNYPVNWTFTAVKHNDSVYYGKEHLDTFTVTDKYCGQLKFRYDDVTESLQHMFGTFYNYSMLHFIAFNTDRPIEDLRGADISYVLNTYLYEDTMMDDASETVTSTSSLKSLSATESDSFQGGIFGHKYTWNEIMTKDDFVNNVVTHSSAFFNSQMTVSGADDLEGKDWVLCFLVTETQSYYQSSGMNYYEMRTYSWVTDETILQFTVMEHGDLVVYGVVDNYQAGDGIPDNEENYGFNEEWWSNWWDELKSWLKIILIVLGVIALGFLLYLLTPVLRLVWFIVTLPFKAIKHLLGKGKEIHSEQAPRAPRRYRYRR